MLQINAVKSEKPDKEVLELLHRIQSKAIHLSADTGELISLLKKKDPEYKKQLEAMEK